MSKSVKAFFREKGKRKWEPVLIPASEPTRDEELIAVLQASYELATCQRNDGDDVAAMIRKALRKLGVRPK